MEPRAHHAEGGALLRLGPEPRHGLPTMKLVLMVNVRKHAERPLQPADWLTGCTAFSAWGHLQGGPNMAFAAKACS